MIEETKQFFGMKEYVGVEDTGKKTPNGIAIIKVLFVDGTSETTTQVFDIVKASVPVDATSRRALTSVPLIQQIFCLFSDFNLSNDDVGYVNDQVINTYNTTLANAQNHLFGVQHVGNLGMLRINEVNEQAEASKKQ